jgi:hypothetical protein
MNDFNVKLTIDSVVKLITQEVEHKNITGILVDKYKRSYNDKELYVLVFEKHFYRVQNRATVTVVIDDFEDKTRIHIKSAGGGALIRFDWGASKSFEKEIYNALEKYII